MPKTRHQVPERLVRSAEKNQISRTGSRDRAPRKPQRSSHRDGEIHPHRGAAAQILRDRHVRHKMARLQTENRVQAPRDDGPRVAAGGGVGADVDAGVDAEVTAVAEVATAAGTAEEEKGASLGNRAEQLLERRR